MAYVQLLSLRRPALESIRLENMFADKEEMLQILRDPDLLDKWKQMLQHVCVDRGIDLEAELLERTKEGPGPKPAEWEWDSEDDEKHGVNRDEQMRIAGTLAHDDPGTSSGSSCSSSEHAPCIPSTAPEALRAKRNAAFAHLF